MKIRHVKPSSIKVPEVRVTAQFDAETQEMLAKAWKEVGQVAPIVGCEIGGEIVLVDGFHRLQEALKGNDESIDIAIMPGDMVDVLTRNLFLDHVRGKHPVSEMVKVVEALRKEFNLDMDQIAAKTGMSRDYVETLALIGELTPLCRAMLDEAVIKVGHAKQLTRIKDPVAQETYAQQTQLYRWNVKQLAEAVDEYLRVLNEPPPPPTPPAPPREILIRCVYCGNEHKPTEIANPSTCRECNAVMLASMTQARREAEAQAAAPPPAAAPPQ